MTVSGLARGYGALTPEERFRLIAAAGARGDDVEQERLTRVARRLTLSMPDHAPFCHAFNELSLLVLIELLEEAARYREAWDRFDDFHELFEEGSPKDELAQQEPLPRSPRERGLDLALAAGYVLRTKTDGWKLFCARLSLPPFAGLEEFPGFDRLQRALALAEKAAFAAEGFLRWLNRLRPPEAPEATEAPLTVAGVAAATEGMFRSRVEWWGG